MKIDMLEAFKGVQKLNEKNKKEMLKTSLIVLDTNILLDVFRYKMSTSDEFFDALQEYKDSLWLPYQVGVEFFKNKDKVSSDYSSNIKNLISKITSSKKTIENEINNKKKLIPELDDIKELLAENVNALNSKLKEIEKKYKKEYDDFNSIKEENIVSLFEDRIIDKPSDEVYEQIIIEGDKRIKNKIAPGYKDSKKQDYYKDYQINGDYIIFASMIELSKAKNKDVIFISGDVKEDWLDDKESLKYSLQLEFYEKTKHRILYLSKKDFINLHNKTNKTSKISKDATKEIISNNSSELGEIKDFRVTSPCHDDIINKYFYFETFDKIKEIYNNKLYKELAKFQENINKKSSSVKAENSDTNISESNNNQ